MDCNGYYELKPDFMKLELLLYLFVMLTALCPCGVFAQPAECNMGNNWVYPNARKNIGLDFINTESGSFMIDGTIWFQGNFENNGVVNYIYPVSSTLNQFTGTSQQHIKGSGTTRFYNALFNSQLVTGAFSLEQDVVVAHQADFTKGIVTSVQSSPSGIMNSLVMESGASWVNASDQSHVDGFVRKIGNSAFSFPIGDGGYYRAASISAPQNLTDQFAARYVFANPDLGGYAQAKKENTIGTISNREYWVVNRTNGASNVQLTLSWDVNKTSAVMPGSLSDLLIVRWDGSKWINEGQIGVTGNASVGAITAKVTGYGVFTLAVANHMPVAVDDNYLVDPKNEVASGNVLSNDTDADLLVVTKYEIGGVVYLPGNTTVINNTGTLEVYANGRFTFIPEKNYSGDVPVVLYTVSDVNGGFATANLIIRVTSGNHAPLVTVSPVTTKINKPVTGSVTATDADGDALTFTKTVDPAHGVVIVNLDGTITYTPSLDFIGTDNFKMIVSDGKGGDTIVTISILVEGYPNSLPVALEDKFEFTENSGSGKGNVLTNDRDADGNVLLVTQFVVSKATCQPGSAGNLAGVGTITINADGSFVFIPVDNYFGNVPAITYTVSDGQGGLAIANLLITVTSPNHAPVVTESSVSTKINEAVFGSVTATDADGDELTFSKTSDPSHGLVLVNLDGTYTYTPANNYIGADSFKLIVSDGRGGNVTITVTVTIGETSDCEVFIPTGFSPNGDGIHDFFRITCMDRYENPVIEIYNRLGNLIYKREHYGDLSIWGNEFMAFWDGKPNQGGGSSQGVLPSGTYYYALKLGNKLMTGFVFISK